MALAQFEIVDALINKLTLAGYSFHEGDEEVPAPGQTGHWFCWADPGGKTDVECGETVPSYEHAVVAAMTHWFENAKIPLDVTEEPTAPWRPPEPGCVPEDQEHWHYRK